MKLERELKVHKKRKIGCDMDSVESIYNCMDSEIETAKIDLEMYSINRGAERAEATSRTRARCPARGGAGAIECPPLATAPAHRASAWN